MLKQLFCSHDYHLINQHELKSEFDMVVAAGKIPNSWNCLRRKLITDYKCSKCGKLKRLTVCTAY